MRKAPGDYGPYVHSWLAGVQLAGKVVVNCPHFGHGWRATAAGGRYGHYDQTCTVTMTVQLAA